jgi:hypothetical protein
MRAEREARMRADPHNRASWLARDPGRPPHRGQSAALLPGGYIPLSPARGHPLLTVVGRLEGPAGCVFPLDPVPSSRGA